MIETSLKVVFHRKFILALCLIFACLAGCYKSEQPGPLPVITAAVTVSPTMRIPSATLTPTHEPTMPIPTFDNPSPSQPSSPIGIGLRSETVETILAYRDCHGFVMTASFELAGKYFPQLGGWVRVLGAPGLDELKGKGERAQTNGLAYEGLGYGLETSKSTPDEEWKNPISYTQTAKELAEGFGKLLVMGPGFTLMASNEDNYPPMAAQSDIWLFQTQQLQKNPPGPKYRAEVMRIVNLIRSDNPNIKIWAQITLPPDRQPNAAEWLEYRQLIVDLVDGTYIGVYTWDKVDNEIILTTIETIYANVCGDQRVP